MKSLALALCVACSSYAAAEDKPAAKLTRGKHFNKTPAEAVKAMTVPKGFKVTCFAHEPDVRQPNAFCIDDRGRLWVGENYTYTKYGWKPDKRDRILIFEDTDGDGKFDKRKVFTDKITYVSGIELGHGGVWVGSPPNLLFIPDKNGDDIPDGKPEVVLDGWGRQDQHETLNTFTWGPDGWLYGCHGVFTHSRVGKPGTPDKDRIPINAGVWRYHPTRKEFEVFAWGTSNPWGLGFDAKGRLLMTACVIPHLWHVIPGGRYHRQAGQHFRKHIYGDIKTIAKHTHRNFKGRKGGHAHGGALLYLGTSFPSKYRGKLFMCSIHHHMMYIDQTKPKGSGLEGDHFDDFVIANDHWWLGFNLQLGHDGAIYVIDWYDAKECHGQTLEGKETGRIFKISYGDRRAKPVNLAALTSEKLAEHCLSENDWYAVRARRLLSERMSRGKTEVDEKIIGRLKSGLIGGGKLTATQRLQSLWALHQVRGISESDLSKLLSDKDAHIRGWAVRLAAEDKKVSRDFLKELTRLAETDPSASVRLEIASALQRLPHADRWQVLEKLVAHAEDAKDHNLPMMYWYAIEPMVPGDRKRALNLATKSKIPTVRRFIARRATAK